MKVENNSLFAMGGLQVYRSLFLVMCLQTNYVAAEAETDEPFEIVSCILYFNSTESLTPRHWHNIEIFLNVVNFPWSNDCIKLASHFRKPLLSWVQFGLFEFYRLSGEGNTKLIMFFRKARPKHWLSHTPWKQCPVRSVSSCIDHYSVGLRDMGQV